MYNGKIVNIIRKILKLSYAEMAQRLGISPSHFDKIINCTRFMDRAEESTQAAYRALYKSAMSVENAEAIMYGLCLSEGVEVPE